MLKERHKVTSLLCVQPRMWMCVNSDYYHFSVAKGDIQTRKYVKDCVSTYLPVACLLAACCVQAREADLYKSVELVLAEIFQIKFQVKL